MILNIVCPFCQRKHPIPFDFDDVYDCDCGACYWISSSNLLDEGMNMMAGDLWQENYLPFPDEDEVGLCQVVVDREFDQLISLKQSVDEISQMRFCKYDPSAELALVWMKKPF